jgi:hypothetical protein
MSAKLTKARRVVERLHLQADGATPAQLAIWEATNRVTDLETAARQAAVRTARRAAQLMDTVLLVVAALTMAFSLGNIHTFALNHQVADPIAWFLAPAIDLALVAALVGDAVLSRRQLGAGKWATALRWYTGAATLVLNGWEAVASQDPAAIVLHVIPPVLLFVLAEAAVPYRIQFAQTVRLAAGEVDSQGDSVEAPLVSPGQSTPVHPVSTPGRQNPTGVELPQVNQVDTRGDTPTDQVDTRGVPGDTHTPERMTPEEAKNTILNSWREGLSVRETAALSTRSPSYVGRVYRHLEETYGPQPLAGQLALVQ